MAVFTSENKRMSLAEAASIVQDGMTIAIGGGWPFMARADGLAARIGTPGTT